MQNRSKSVDTGICCPTGSGWREGQISLLGSGAHTVSVSCCPIEIGKIEEAELVPCDAANEGEQARKTVRPLAFERDKSQQNVEQEGGPELPADSMLGVAEEITDFKGLFDLIEEGLDSPAAAVQVADAGRSPVQIVGEKDHDSFLSVDFDESLNAPQSLRILSPGLGANQGNLIVTEDFASWFTQSLAVDPVTQVVLGAGDPEDAPLMQIKEADKVHVGLVEDRDLSGLQSGTQGHGPGAVVMGCFLNNGKSRKETLQIESQVHLRGSLATTVLGPVHTVGYQGNSRRIHCMDRPLEPMRQSPVTSCRTKSRRQLLQMGKYLPEKILHHVGVAGIVRMRKRIATRWNRSADYRQFGCMVAQRVADIVQSNRMGQLGEKQAHHMTPRREGPCLLVHSVISGEFLRQVRRDKFTKLMQCVRVMLGRRFCFHILDSLVGIRRRPPFFNRAYQGLQLHPVG